MIKNSQYQEVKEFTVDQTKVDACTSDRFRTAFGVDFCVKLNRPVLGPILEIIKPIDFDSIIDEDMDEDDEEEDSIRRPMLPFAGPYHYEVNRHLSFILKL